MGNTMHIFCGTSNSTKHGPKKSQISLSHNLPFRSDWFNYSRNHPSLLYFAEPPLPKIAGAAHLRGCGSMGESSSSMAPSRGTVKETASIKKVTRKTLPLKELPKWNTYKGNQQRFRQGQAQQVLKPLRQKQPSHPESPPWGHRLLWLAIKL